MTQQKKKTQQKSTDDNKKNNTHQTKTKVCQQTKQIKTNNQRHKQNFADDNKKSQ